MKAVLRQNLTLGILVLIGINMRPLLTSIGLYFRRSAPPAG